MLEAAKFSAAEVLRNGRRLEIRALRPDDQAGLIEAVSRTSDQSLYRRFFGVRRGCASVRGASLGSFTSRFNSYDGCDEIGLIIWASETSLKLISFANTRTNRRRRP